MLISMMNIETIQITLYKEKNHEFIVYLSDSG
jgi:hypothetical protein